MEPVSRWTMEQVVLWIQGLEAGLQQYAPAFLEHRVDGAALLAMSAEQLEVMGVGRLGHQELLLHATGLLHSLHYGLETDSVSAFARKLIAAAHDLQAVVGRRQRRDDAGPASSELLAAVLQLIAVAKALLSWLDRFPEAEEFAAAHNAVVQLCLQLSKVTRQNCTIEEIEEKILHVGSRLQQVCEKTILQSSHRDLQRGAQLVAARLDVRSPEEGLGLYLKTTPEGMHVVTGVVENSPADLSGDIHDGDELIAVDRQTVVGWEMQNVVRVLKQDPSGVEVTLKTHPPFAGEPQPPQPATATADQQHATSDPAAPAAVTSDPAACPHKGQRIRRQKPLDRHAKVKVVVDPAHHAQPEVGGGGGRDGDATPVAALPPPLPRLPPCSSNGADGDGDPRVEMAVRDGNVAVTAIVAAIPTATATPTAIVTAIPTAIVAAIPTVTPIPTVTATPTAIVAAIPTAIVAAIPTTTPTAIVTPISTAIVAAIPTVTPTATPTAIVAAIPTATPTAIVAAIPTATATPTATVTATATVAATSTNTATATATPTATVTVIPTTTLSPTANLTPTVTATATAGVPAHPPSPPRADRKRCRHKRGRSRSFSRGAAPDGASTGARDGDRGGGVGCGGGGGGGSARDHGLSHHQSLPADFRMPENILKHEGASDGTRPPGPAERHGAVAPGLASEASVGPEGRGAADENAGADNYRSVSRQNADRTSKTPAAAEILPSVLRPLSGTAEAFAANNVRMRNKNHIKGKATKMSRRRISCKDLGAGDLEGWVWKKKQIKSFFKPSWNRFWFVLQRSSVYWYTHRNDLKADGYINLQGFKVDRALESRRKFAFKATHPSIKPLYFATDSAEDMYRWIEKLRVVAIASASTEKEDQAADVSESEDDSEEGSAYGSLRSSSSVLRAPSLPVLNMPTGPLKYRHPSCERLCPLASPAPSLSCQQLQWDSPPAAPAGNVTATATAGTAVSLRSPAADRRSLAVSPTPSFLRRSWQALFGGHCELELAGVGAGAAENDRGGGGGGDAGGRLGDDERKRKQQQQQQQQQQQGHVRSTSDAEPTPKAAPGGRTTTNAERGRAAPAGIPGRGTGRGGRGAGVARGRPEIDAAAGGGGRRVGSLPDLASRLPASRDGGRRPCAAPRARRRSGTKWRATTAGMSCTTRCRGRDSSRTAPSARSGAPASCGSPSLAAAATPTSTRGC
ncbi:connector enhancer of kinase suppressor of ras 2-like isoform X2 [Petromyzon marinus]|uniref:connector enhancer of kinase suppressor of ras 2-like isoform X2 n=1 Tax=Petromyzon marinus TaxID=7757 RepID=UPI003F717CC0